MEVQIEPHKPNNMIWNLKDIGCLVKAISHHMQSLPLA